ncbi:MAG: hypothetical protein AAFX87_24075 [Bacteroidota bacterium]
MKNNAMDLEGLIKKSSKHVLTMLSDKLSTDLFYHNVRHTLDVVTSTVTIAETSRVSYNEFCLLQIAAWFHDTGFCNNYCHHEDTSKSIAEQFLQNHGLPQAEIDIVKTCIEATRMPQKPETLLQEIMCDADLSHLGCDAYMGSLESLRKEWETCLEKSYNDDEWLKLNIEFLSQHKYFTEYGQRILEPLKQSNLERLREMSKARGPVAFVR